MLRAVSASSMRQGGWPDISGLGLSGGNFVFGYVPLRLAPQLDLSLRIQPWIVNTGCVQGVGVEGGVLGIGMIPPRSLMRGLKTERFLGQEAQGLAARDARWGLRF